MLPLVLGRNVHWGICFPSKDRGGAMKLEHQVSSPEPSKRLKELGVEQESAFYWSVGKHYTTVFCELIRGKRADTVCGPHEEFSAFTVAESLEALPVRGPQMSTLNIQKLERGYAVGYIMSSSIPVFEDLKLEDALSNLRIHLIEKGIVKP